MRPTSGAHSSTMKRCRSIRLSPNLTKVNTSFGGFVRPGCRWRGGFERKRTAGLVWFLHVANLQQVISGFQALVRLGCGWWGSNTL
ncbi:transcription factor hes-1 [Plakobranchus ocellatus]|uniref:Transcription factor hes-1 n=1 Tax=Plakobranchus ocellatus TaxID=259542 RepID=A0AAV4AL20_9GAST|nr:transcription factor hes-1 [Plakobranchus ocellatus]